MSVKRHIPTAFSLAAALMLGTVAAIAPAHSAQPAAGAAPSTPPAAAQPAGGVDMTKAKASFESSCSGCHEPSLATAQRHNRQGWEAVVDRMVGFGLTAPEPQLNEIITYLAATYPAE